ncbi:DeoR/GlpR family DNA-binding transcription regulator [Bacillus sp. FJAT-50079]|uniref:DeoR/GlpR family DNA-binding transcription regulator n=1 Tax=Bacillus sp. FJAT-50079 TaxID=2833577 RepID=UPI001BC9F613|nr:DeoR/GlpR family DNA-binding transcription regulator [Bacillus sp. FJAT-50079]MBS4206990.1 DeoR/GlpR transcriptional regulator [Bacillus sp. FJAT-50079]
MLPYDRREGIINLLKNKKSVSVDEFCTSLYASPATIRRDLAALEREGMIRRIRGGALLLSEHSHEVPFTLREKDQTDKKEKMASLAVQLIKDDQKIFLDSSSSVLRLARKLDRFKGLTILTNGNETSKDLGERTSAEVYCTGGRVRENSASLVGAQTCEYIARHNADIAFLSCRGLDPTIGATVSTEDEAIVKRQFSLHAKIVVLLCDSSKFNKQYFYTSIPMNKISVIVTDREVSQDFYNVAKQNNIKIISS